MRTTLVQTAFDEVHLAGPPPSGFALAGARRHPKLGWWQAIWVTVFDVDAGARISLGSLEHTGRSIHASRERLPAPVEAEIERFVESRASWRPNGRTVLLRAETAERWRAIGVGLEDPRVRVRSDRASGAFVEELDFRF